MSKAARPNNANSYVIEANSDEDVEFSLRAMNSGNRYDVVDYADPILAEKLQAREPGNSVRVDLAPVDEAANRWAVTRHLPGASPRIGLGR
ncbi:hypothetical protein ACOZ4I_01740 [Haloarcula salina]|uniref:hypothetical protein n=1 Tax=Haloarcula salina TaxID=1429914 RepID=UPI003C7016A8